MTDPRPPPPRLVKQREELRNMVLLPALVAVGIHIAMLVVGKYLPSEARLLATVGYFGALLLALWKLRELLPAFLEAEHDWRYKRTHMLIVDASRRVQISARAINEVGTPVLMAFLATTGALVLLRWPQFHELTGLAPPLSILWYLMLIAIPVATIYCEGQILTLLGRRRFLAEEAGVLAVPVAAEPAAGAPAVEVTGEHAFRAGGIDWTWDMLASNMIVLGEIGTGKTNCVLNSMLDGLLSSGSRTGQRPALILFDGKGDFAGNDCARLRALCRKAGRLDDLRIIDPMSPESSERWNPFDSDDSPFEIASRLAVVMEMLGSTNSGGDDAFWIESAKTFLEHATGLLRVTAENAEPPSFRDVMLLAASPEEISRRGHLITDPATMHSLESTIDYFADTWLEMEPKMQSTILAFLRNMIGPFLNDPFTRAFAGRSTVTTGEVLDKGLILYLRMPTAEQEAMSRIISTLLKLEMQLEVRRRVNKQRYSLFVCDEFQQYLTAGKQTSDAAFFAVNRQSRHVNLIATQSLHTLTEKAARERVMSLLGTCSTKVFLRNSEIETNRYAAELFGQVPMRLPSEQGQSAGLLREMLGGRSNMGSSTSLVQRLPPEVFTALDIPTPRGVAWAESVVHLGKSDSSADLGRRTFWPLHPLEALTEAASSITLQRVKTLPAPDGTLLLGSDQRGTR